MLSDLKKIYIYCSSMDSFLWLDILKFLKVSQLIKVQRVSCRLAHFISTIRHILPRLNDFQLLLLTPEPPNFIPNKNSLYDNALVSEPFYEKDDMWYQFNHHIKWVKNLSAAPCFEGCR